MKRATNYRSARMRRLELYSKGAYVEWVLTGLNSPRLISFGVGPGITGLMAPRGNFPQPRTVVRICMPQFLLVNLVRLLRWAASRRENLQDKRAKRAE